MAVSVSALLLSCSLSLSSSDNLVSNYLLQVGKGKDNYLLQVNKGKDKDKDNYLLQVDKANHSETGADYSEDGGSEEEGPSEATRTKDQGGEDYSGLPGGSKCHTQKGEVCTFPFKYTDGKHNCYLSSLLLVVLTSQSPYFLSIVLIIFRTTCHPYLSSPLLLILLTFGRPYTID